MSHNKAVVGTKLSVRIQFNEQMYGYNYFFTQPTFDHELRLILLNFETGEKYVFLNIDLVTSYYYNGIKLMNPNPYTIICVSIGTSSLLNFVLYLL